MRDSISTDGIRFSSQAGSSLTSKLTSDEIPDFEALALFM
jgi:hypothetical protein